MHQMKNYMEEIVFAAMEDILKDINMCTCDRCKYDIAAKALNDLPPQYIVTQKGEIYSKINNLMAQFEVDVISAITKAAIIVKRNPNHDLDN
ncbi:MAG: late competence development ComFB family protein [Clostridiaceae bacterium]|jgi:competence protein ComFB|nr:late competence development ComFB family protein [Clostridiaceae bacterium]